VLVAVAVVVMEWRRLLAGLAAVAQIIQPLALLARQEIRPLHPLLKVLLVEAALMLVTIKMAVAEVAVQVLLAQMLFLIQLVALVEQVQLIALLEYL
jgi:hypothetical protein